VSPPNDRDEARLAKRNQYETEPESRRRLHYACSTQCSFWLEWNHKENRSGNPAQNCDEAGCISPLAQPLAQGNPCECQHGHSKTDINRLPKIRQALTSCGE